MMKIDDLHNDLAMWHFSISAFQHFSDWSGRLSDFLFHLF